MKFDITSGRLKHIDPKLIDENPENPRLIFRQEEMEQLLASIDQYGIQVPLVVYEAGERYRLIDGERRWRCAKKLRLKTVPALVQRKPTELENLLLMYNIHALREQWDYFTTASKLDRVINLLKSDLGRDPNEPELAEATGLTRGQIRRCRLLLDLPEKYTDLLLEELKLPKSQQKLSEDFFIEMEKSIKTVVNRIPDYARARNKIRDALISKYRDGSIRALTDFRQLSKIATAVKRLGLSEKNAKKALERVFDSSSTYGIRDAYHATVEFGYSEREALRYAESLQDFLDHVLEEDKGSQLDDRLIKHLRGLYERLRKVLRG